MNFVFSENLVIQEFSKYKLKPIATLSHEEQYVQALRRCVYAAKLEENLALKDPNEWNFFQE